jgi:hypothetical protein
MNRNPLLRALGRSAPLSALILSLCAPQLSARAQGQTDWLGQDLELKATDEGPVPGVAGKIGWFIPNRLLDLLDPLHVDVGFGLGLHVNGHATRALQVGFGASGLRKIGIDGRQIGSFGEDRTEISILPFSIESFNRSGTAFGTFRPYDTATQREQLYRRERDYFEVGAAATAGIVGVSADVRPSSILDAVVGWVGLDLEGDDRPIPFTRDKVFRLGRQGYGSIHSIEKLAIVTSRAIESPHVGSETDEGVAVFNHRSSGEFFFGDLGRLLNIRADEREQQQLNETLRTVGYDMMGELADRFTTAFRANHASAQIVPASTFNDVAGRRVHKRVGDETVLRLPNYRGLAQAYNTDAVLDLRLLEWSIFQHKPGVGLRIRLNVEVKLIKFPENELLVDISHLVYDIGKEGHATMEDFRALNARVLRLETQQAMDILIAGLIDKLFEN